MADAMTILIGIQHRLAGTSSDPKWLNGELAALHKQLAAAPPFGDPNVCPRNGIPCSPEYRAFVEKALDTDDPQTLLAQAKLVLQKFFCNDVGDTQIEGEQ